MKILLVRHGEAVDQVAGIHSDADRWLTAKGRKTTRDVAARVVTLWSPTDVWTSPLVRAVQTAEILASASGLEGRVSVVRAIATGELDVLIHGIRTWQGDGVLALVGHEPTLSTLASTLLDEPDWRGFDKSGVCAMTWSGTGSAHFEWALLPRDLTHVTSLRRMVGAL
jgi:phosphohistidine phosphatase